MPDYTCERCLKEFSQKSHYDKHMNRKRPCQDNKKTLEKVVEGIITNKLEGKKNEHIAPTEPSVVENTFTDSTKTDIVSNTGEKTQKVVKEDCIEGMKKIKDESVDIVICDPPYNIGKDFGNNSDKQKMDDYLVWCDDWIRECIRILKPAGTLYIYGFSEILAFIRVRININVRWIIWHYTNKVTPSLNFWQRTHESILCCYKEKPVFNKDDVREPYTDTFLKNAAGKVRKATKGRFSNGEKETTYTAHANGALPRDVIKISALAGGAGKKERVNHPTQKPLELCEKLIKASKNGEDTVLVVPFAGSGSECVAAKKHNIHFIGYEINEDYVDLCNERLRGVETS
jgi:site-specific DNA-methyltransferase (adenine-specific)